MQMVGNNIAVKPFRKMNDLEDFLSKLLVNAESGCQEFTGFVSPDGYGEIQFRGERWRTHRLAYYISNGPFDSDLCVLHMCDNRRCCNPDHLFLGTRTDNYRDMVLKGRHMAMKLNATQVFKVIEMNKRGMKGSQIAKLFKVHKNTIYDILKGITWQHLFTGK